MRVSLRADTTPPSVVSAEVAAAESRSLVITFDEALDTDSRPAASAFTVKVGGNTGPTVHSVNVIGDDVRLTFRPALDASQTNVTVDYTQPGTNKLQDPFGNEVASFTNRAVVNNAPACPRNQPAAAFWEACLTVGKHSTTNIFGYGGGSYGALSATQFIVDSTTFTVPGLRIFPNGSLRITFAGGDPVAAGSGSWVLQVGGESLAMSAGTYNTEFDHYTWSAPGITWTVATVDLKVSVSLRVADNTAPEVSGAEVTAAKPKELVIDFNEALDTGSVPAASQFTVKVGGSTSGAPSVSSVAIDGDKVKLALGVALDAGQTSVTVDYTKPGTDPLQDASENEVATFTNRAVTNNAPACPTAQPAGAFWTACLTVGKFLAGYGFAGVQGLLPRMFTLDSTSYTIDGLCWNPRWRRPARCPRCSCASSSSRRRG